MTTSLNGALGAVRPVYSSVPLAVGRFSSGLKALLDAAAGPAD